jgi:hypothetical protein
MQNWSISLEDLKVGTFSPQKHGFVTIPNFMDDPGIAIAAASLQKFAKITPQYPGIRSPLPESVADQWLEQLQPMLRENFGSEGSRWQIQAWFSIVTNPPASLLPIQRLPHVDGTDRNVIAMMLYLDHTDHGGTAFFRHRATGFEDLTAETFPIYKASLENDVRKTGMPPAQYVTDGAPHFERIHASSGAFNEAVFYRGNVFHSGAINNELALSPDPRVGRFTINATFRPL